MTLDHIGIAVRDLDLALSHYESLVGIECSGRERIDDQGVEVAFIDLGDSKIEFLAPLHEDSPVAKFIEKRGEGMHHTAFFVQDLPAEIARFVAQGYQFLSDEPSVGAGGKQVIFMHPKEHHGVLLELCSKAVMENSPSSHP
jgi:methylmalonyl-CoA/ethylmalonyl-CoA epimerase